MIKTICIVLATLGATIECPDSLEMIKKKTPIQELELKTILQESHLQVFGKPGSINRINMAWAQIAFENGRGKLVYNHNLGNIGTHVRKSIKPYYKVADSRFISFLSFKEAATAYWQVLKNNCPGSLKSFDLGDPKSSSIMLKKCKYYTLDSETYFFSLNSLFSYSFKVK